MSRPERLELEGDVYGGGFFFSAPLRLCGEYSADLNVLLYFLRLCACITLLAAVSAWAGDGLVAVPSLSARVTDLTGTLDAGQRAALEDRLAAFEKEKGSQIALLMLPSTKPETIEQYGIRVAEAWKVGRKGKDDGVILLVAKDDHKLRIEVGYGLEGGLTDAASKLIIAEIMAPRFKAGDWVGGLSAGVEAIQKVIGVELAPAAVPKKTPGSSGGGFFSSLLSSDDIAGLLVFLVIGLPAFIAHLITGLLGRLPGSAVCGALAGGAIYLLFSYLGGAILVGLVVFCLVFFLVANGAGRGMLSGWSGGSSGGGGFSGWSGGGGGFGGGGASGDW